MKDPAISGMGLVFDGLSLDKMMVRSESRSEAVRICSSHGKLFSARYSHGCSATKHRGKFISLKLITMNIDLSTMQPGYYGEGSIDVCQARALVFVVMLSPKTS